MQQRSPAGTADLDLGPGPHVSEADPARASAPVPRPSPKLSTDADPHAGARVLVIEDDADARRALAIRLRANHYEVVCAGEGVNAVALAQKVKPHVILLDLGLPGVDGLDVLARLRAVAPPAGYAVIVLSGWDEERYKPLALELGALRYFRKPVADSTLLDAIRKLVR